MNIPLVPEPVAHVGAFTITNSMINGWVALLILLMGGYALRRIALVPGRFQATLELVHEGLWGFAQSVTGDMHKTRLFFPLFGSFFIYIALSNLLGLVPGVGTIGRWLMMHGELELIPLFRPVTSDLAATAAMAVAAVGASHLLGISQIGLFHHLDKFFPIWSLWKAMRRLSFMDSLVALVKFLVGIIEVFAEFAKVLSLSLRLFGNIFAGEVLLHAISAVAPYVAPLPFLTMEILVGIVQATVFSTLVLVYFQMSVEAHGDESEAGAH